MDISNQKFSIEAIAIGDIIDLPYSKIDPQMVAAIAFLGGNIDPIVVKRVGGFFQIVGRSNIAIACLKAGLDTVNAIVVNDYQIGIAIRDQVNH